MHTKQQSLTWINQFYAYMQEQHQHQMYIVSFSFCLYHSAVNCEFVIEIYFILYPFLFISTLKLFYSTFQLIKKVKNYESHWNID